VRSLLLLGQVVRKGRDEKVRQGDAAVSNGRERRKTTVRGKTALTQRQSCTEGFQLWLYSLSSILLQSVKHTWYSSG
jgi:hypothetical protein